MSILMLNGKPYGSKAYDKSNNYSTEEQVIGTWIDGKPIYQKTLIIENNEGLPTDVLIRLREHLPEVDKFIQPVTGLGYNKRNEVHFIGNLELNLENAIRSGYDKIYIGNGFVGEYAMVSLYINVQYTKTTD